METIHLIGSEQVQNAGYAMGEAADTMQRAANSISDTLFTFSQKMEEWVERLEALSHE